MFANKKVPLWVPALSGALFLLVIGFMLVDAALGQGQQPPGLGSIDLIGGLKATPGCLGVEVAKTGGGKQVIFAWFEDKAAVLRWYYSDTHQKAMKTFFRESAPGQPLKDIPDGTGPIMAIASITFTDKSQFQETSLPISQIAIELYQPLTGGIFLGGRFAPERVKVHKLLDLGPLKEKQR